jgi:hypothetical protein
VSRHRYCRHIAGLQQKRTNGTVFSSGPFELRAYPNKLKCSDFIWFLTLRAEGYFGPFFGYYTLFMVLKCKFLKENMTFRKLIVSWSSSTTQKKWERRNYTVGPVRLNLMLNNSFIQRKIQSRYLLFHLFCFLSEDGERAIRRNVVHFRIINLTFKNRDNG